MLKKILVLSLSLLTVNYNLHAAEPNFSLHKAAHIGDIAAVQELLKRRDVNEKDNNGWTPLHHAAESGHLEVVQVLLADSRCTTVNEKDNAGFTPLHCAADFGRHAMVQVLLADRRCTTVNEKDNGGRTPLHCAVFGGYHTVVQLLLDARCNINEKDNYGKTPLHYAARLGRHAVVQVLLADSNCKVNEKNNGGRTPLDVARLLGKHDIEYLIAYWNDFIKGLHISWYTSILAGTHPRCGALSSLRTASRDALKEILSYLRQGTCIYNPKDIARYVAIAQQQQQGHGTGWCTIS